MRDLRLTPYATFPLRRRAWVALALFGALISLPAAAAEHRFGIGVHYWDAIDDVIGDGFDIDEDGVTGILSYQYRPGGLLSFELDLEIAPEGFGGSNDVTFSPTAFVLFGKGLYVGVGIGLSFASDLQDNVSDPFYAARVGFNFLLLPRISLDVNANYRADAFNELDDFDSDALTLGAIIRVRLGG